MLRSLASLSKISAAQMPVLEELLEMLRHLELVRRHKTALHFALAGGHAEAADKLLSHGEDISPINKKGQAFLHLALILMNP